MGLLSSAQADPWVPELRCLVKGTQPCQPCTKAIVSQDSSKVADRLRRQTRGPVVVAGGRRRRTFKSGLRVHVDTVEVLRADCIP